MSAKLLLNVAVNKKLVEVSRKRVAFCHASSLFKRLIQDLPFCCFTFLRYSRQALLIILMTFF